MTKTLFTNKSLPTKGKIKKEAEHVDQEENPLLSAPKETNRHQVTAVNSLHFRDVCPPD